MTTISATIPVVEPPAWAVLERRLFDALNASVHPFLEKYTRPDGTLTWRETFRGRDTDDLYESFYNWPLLHLLGGDDALLPLSVRQWEAVTKQLTAYGLLHKEYPRCIDQFHQAESDLYFYFLCLADPASPAFTDRARRFAGLFTDEDPDAPNYDPARRLIRAPLNGSAGPHEGFFDGESSYGYSPGMARYGLPYHDLPGLSRYEDLKDPALARVLGQAMQERMGKGDVVGNLGLTSLVTNACLMTGDGKYRRWVLDYTDAWMDRARKNNGLLPDNVGLSGRVGEYVGGKWYGGLYGWTWPHGFYNVGMAALVAASNALLLTRDAGYLDLPRAQIDRVMEQGLIRDLRDCDMSLPEHWVGQLAGLGDQRETFVVPYRFGDPGWFDYQPMTPIYPVALHNLSQSDADRDRVERLRRAERYDWSRVFSFRTKEDAGHEQPWTRFLAGENPAYPEAILQAAYAQVHRRLTQIREDRSDLTTLNIHHWQQLNPVTTEALVQLTLGAPQVLYNGGLLMARVRYFDPDRRRPGLPPDVAALVSRVEADRTVLHLVNLSPCHARNLVIQAGAFGEHRFTEVHYDARTSDYPGPVGDYAAPPLRRETRTASVRDKHLRVRLPPASEITLDLRAERFVHNPSYAAPW